MNKKGQNLMLAIGLAIMIFASGMLMANFLKDEVTTFRAAADCSNLSISDGVKISCLVGDLVIPYFIWGVLSLAGGVLMAKFLL